MSPQKRAERDRASSGSWISVVITGILVGGLVTVPKTASHATRPPETNNRSWTQHLSCCCSGSPVAEPGDVVALQPPPNCSSPGETGRVDNHPPLSDGAVAVRNCTTAGDEHSADTQLRQPNSRSGATSIERPRRRENAPALPRFLYVSSTLSPGQVFETMRSPLPADPMETMALLDRIFNRESMSWTTPTASPRVAYGDARSLRRPPSTRSVWVYELRADQTFYDLGESLHWHVSQRSPAEQADDRGTRLRGAETRATYRQSWVTLSEVPTENIRRAFPITEQTPCPSDSRQPFPSDTAVENSRYVSLNTRGSDQLLTWPNG